MREVPCPGRTGPLTTLTRRDMLRNTVAAGGFLGLPDALLTAPVAAASAPLAGAIVFLDPGHNGANDASIDRPVPTGRGGTKVCQTTGTNTDSGYPEHSFNWDVVLRIRQELSRLGVRTAMSRGNDNALGPCVDQRAEMANALHPDAVLSVHADGGPPSGRGFHVNYSSPALNAAQSGPSLVYAKTMRDALAGAGMTPSTYIGNDGLYGRSDLTGLNLAQYPSILVETGNMKNAHDAALMETPTGRAAYAAAIASGVAEYLNRR